MYRPTVRYDDVYQEYVTNVFNATHLDRSQIIRAALFIAGHTEQFSKIIEPYLKRGVSLPAPIWSEDNHELWLNQKVEQQVIDTPVREPVQTKTTKYEQMRVEEQMMSSPKPKVFTGGIKFAVK